MPLLALEGMVPESGWIAPASALISVDLPAPFSPSSAWISPAHGEIRSAQCLHTVVPFRPLVACPLRRPVSTP